MHIATPTNHQQQGFSLIEALISIVVMTLGILGILGVQMRTLADTQTGVRRAQAIRLIEDLGERLQSNPDALSNLNIYTTTPTGGTDCAAAACDPASLATYDIQRWRTNVNNTLPLAYAQVFIPQGGARQLGVIIGWRESRYNSNDKALSANDITSLNQPFSVAGINSGGTALACPANLICHLQYIQPTQRCTPWGQNTNQLYCPN